MGESKPSAPKRLRQCDECGEWFSEKTTMFDLIMQVQAEVPEVLDLDALGDEAESPIEEMERIIEALDQLTPAQAKEAEAQIYEEFRFLICPKCRKRVAQRLRRQAIEKQLMEFGAEDVEETAPKISLDELSDEEIPLEEIKMPEPEVAASADERQGESAGSPDDLSFRAQRYLRDSDTEPL